MSSTIWPAPRPSGQVYRFENETKRSILSRPKGRPLCCGKLVFLNSLTCGYSYSYWCPQQSGGIETSVSSDGLASAWNHEIRHHTLEDSHTTLHQPKQQLVRYATCGIRRLCIHSFTACNNTLPQAVWLWPGIMEPVGKTRYSTHTWRSINIKSRLFLSTLAYTRYCACGTAALPAHDSFIWLRHYTAASNALPSISPATLRSRSSTLARISFSILCLSEARVHSSSYCYCCCLFLSPAYLTSSPPRLLSRSSCSSSSSVFLLLRERGACSRWGGRRTNREVYKIGPVSLIAQGRTWRFSAWEEKQRVTIFGKIVK